MSLDFGLMEHHYFHNLHYEKFSDGTVKCIEDEIPFDLPEGWEWCRLSDIFIVCSSKRVLQSDWKKEGVPFYRAREIVKLSECGTVENELFISENHYNELKSKYGVPQIGDLMVSGVGTIGKVYVVTERDRFYYKDASVLCFQNAYNSIDSEFAKYMLESEFIQRQMHSNSKGTTVDTITISTAMNYLLLLPPLHEQKRIVSKINELLSLVNAIESDKSTLQSTIQLTKSKILDLAIRGKLVPQNPDDEPASVLLDRIRTEKEELIKQGKIKRDKKESVIFKGDDNSYYEKIGDTVTCIDEELPFDIPDNWAWIRLSSACIINPKNSIADDTIVSFVPMTLIQDGYANEFTFEQRKWGEVKKGFTHFAENDVGFAKITPCFENRKSVVFRGLCNGYGAGTTELHILRAYPDTILPEYFLYLVKTESFISGGKQTFSGAVGQQRVGKEYVYNYFCPVPPLSEQQRIIKKCSDIMTMLNSIEKSLS